MLDDLPSLQFKKWTDSAIHQAILKDNKQVYDYLISRYKRQFQVFTQKNNGTWEDGEDLFTDVLIILRDAIQQGKYQHQERFEKYLATLRWRRWNEYQRQKKRNPSIVGQEEWSVGQEEDDDERLAIFEEPSDYLGWKEWQLDTMHECLSQLKPEEKSLLEKVYLENSDLKLTELEQRWGVQNLKQRLYNIKKKLRALMLQSLKNKGFSL